MESVTKDRLTYTVDEAAQLGGFGRNTAYEEIRTKGTVAGVRVIRVGQKGVRIPKAAYDKVLAGEVE